MTDRIKDALHYAERYGQTDGDHHKAWVIDQMVRALTGCPMVKQIGHNSVGGEFEYDEQGESDEYLTFVREYQDGEDGPQTYEWDEGIAP